MATDHLQIGDIAAAQSNKEVTANEAHNLLDRALNQRLPKAISGSVSLSVTEARQNTLIELTGTPGAPFNLDMPDTNERALVIFNNTDDVATLRNSVSGGSGAPVIAVGKLTVFHYDGTNFTNYTDLFDLASSFTELTDTPATYVGQGLKILGVNVAEDAIEFIENLGGGGGGGTTILGEDWEVISRQVVSAARANVELTFDETLWDELELVIIDSTAETDATGLIMRVSTDGGSTFDTTAIYDWAHVRVNPTPTGADDGAALATSWNLSELVGHGDDTGEVFSGTYKLTGFDNALVYTQLRGNGVIANKFTAGLTQYDNSGLYRSLTAVNAIQVLGSGGNILAGTFILRGRRKNPVQVNLQSVVVATKPKWRGCVARLSTDLLTQDYTGFVAIDFDAEDFDTDDFHDNSVNNSRITIPDGSGITKVQLTANVRIADTGTNQHHLFAIRMNGTGVCATQRVEVSPTTSEASLTTLVIGVVDGDYFEVFVQVETDMSVTVSEVRTNFTLEVKEELGSNDVPTAFIALDKPHKGALLSITSDFDPGSGTPVNVPWDEVIEDTLFDPDDGGLKQRFWLGPDLVFTAVADDTVTATAHGMVTGEGPFEVTTSAADLPAGLSITTPYWCIRIDDDDFYIATSRANALADTRVDITDAGTGTHTLDRATRFVVPAGVARIEITYNISTQAQNSTTTIYEIFLNGARAAQGYPSHRESGAGSNGSILYASGKGFPVAVSEGDVLEMNVHLQDGADIRSNLDNTWFGITVVEVTKVLAFPGVTVQPPFRGALAYNSGDFAHTSSSAWVPVTFNLEGYDTDDFHDIVSDTTEMVIPAGVTRVRMSGGVRWAASSTGNRGLRFQHNGGDIIGGGETFKNAVTGNVGEHNLVSAVVDVVEGDIMTFDAFQSSGGTLSIFHDGGQSTYFSIQVVEEVGAASPPEPIDIFLEAQHWDLDAIPVSQPVFKKIATRRFSLFDDFAGSVGQADAGPNGGAVDFDVLRNGSSIGTISFADSTGAAQTATFTTAGGTEEAFEVGDRLEIETPADIQSMNEVVISLWAFRT